MKRALLVFAIVSASAIGSALAVGCSSSTTPPVNTGGKDSGTDTGAATGDTGAAHPDTGTTMATDSGCVAPYDAAAYANSVCGHPGDKGNAAGVGSFCVTSNDCACNSNAPICSSLGNGMGTPTYFCTNLCMAADGGDAGCGESATCECQNGGGECACTPNTCVGGPPADAGPG